jgi:hypothetical protein
MTTFVNERGANQSPSSDNDQVCKIEHKYMFLRLDARIVV